MNQAADGFVVLTESGRATLFPNGTPSGQPMEIIPCCVDPRRFAAAGASDRETVRAQLGVSGRAVFVYVGTIGGNYVVKEMVELLSVARQLDSRAFALVLTQTPPDTLVQALKQSGFSDEDYFVAHAALDEVPRFLLAADVGLCLIRSSYAGRSQSPTKFAEYLASGLPVMATAGIGDLDRQIEQNRIGVILRTFDCNAYRDALAAIEQLRRDVELAERCRRTAHIDYDLCSVGGLRYRRLYDAVIQRSATA